MKSVSLVLALVVTAGLAACNDDSPTDPSDDLQFTFAAPLTVAAEVPAPSGPETSGSGQVTVTMNVVRDSGGNVTSATANFVTTLTNFPQSTNITIAHIHEGAVGVAGPIVVNTGLASGETPISANGTGSFAKNSVPVTTTIANGLINNTAGFYFNVHSQVNGPGIVRGQLIKQ